MEAEAEAAAPLPVQQVYATLEAALSLDAGTRGAAEAQLRAWEADAAPGFIGSLLKVVAEVAAVPEVRGRREAGGGRPAGGRHEAAAACRRHRARSTTALQPPATSHCPQAGRLMAAVVAKNAVGSSWRKTVGSREWSRVPGAHLPPAPSCRGWHAAAAAAATSQEQDCGCQAEAHLPCDTLQAFPPPCALLQALQ